MARLLLVGLGFLLFSGKVSPAIRIGAAVGLVVIVGVMCLGEGTESPESRAPTRVASFQPSHRQEGGRTVIRIGHSPDIAPLFEALITTYNQSSREYRVERQGLELEPLLEAAVHGGLVAISPDASLVLNSVERAWREAQPDAAPLVGYTVRYATSPVVIAIREERMPRPAPGGWQALLTSNVKWAHLSSSTTSSGLLALAAEFYAATGAEKLSREDIDRTDVLERVSAIEKSIARYGGDSEEKVVDYLLTPEGTAAVDAMVLSEAQVVSLNGRAAAQRLSRWQAVYPEEGTLMMDHPLTLLEHPSLSPLARRAFLDFARFVSTQPAQALVIQHGYRPASYQADLASGPLTPANGVNPAQPRLLPLPSPGVLTAMRDYWAGGLKRAANILLIVDVSGSMNEGGRLPQAIRALEAFVTAAAQRGGRDRIGLDSFSTTYDELVPIRPVAENAAPLLQAIRALKPQSNTALFYAAWAGQQKLLALNDPDRINAVVLMTDGLENQSKGFVGKTAFDVRVPTLRNGSEDTTYLTTALRASRRERAFPVLLFTVGYGSGASELTMRQIAAAGGGQYYFADTATIAKLYPLIQENF